MNIRKLKKVAKKQSDKKSLNDYALNMLKNPTLSYETKVKIIEIFYNLPKISDYVEYFCKQMEKKYKTQNSFPRKKQKKFGEKIDEMNNTF